MFAISCIAKLPTQHDILDDHILRRRRGRKHLFDATKASHKPGSGDAVHSKPGEITEFNPEGIRILGKERFLCVSSISSF